MVEDMKSHRNNLPLKVRGSGTNHQYHCFKPIVSRDLFQPFLSVYLFLYMFQKGTYGVSALNINFCVKYEYHKDAVVIVTFILVQSSY